MNRLSLGSWLLVVVLAVGASSLARPAQAQEADARYQTTVEEAVHEFSLNNWAEARALFRRAHALQPSARTFRGMGMAAFELKMYVEALRELTAALADTQRPLTEEQRAQVQKLIEQSRAYVGRYQVVLAPATAHPMVDGQEAQFDPGNVLLLALGDHVISVAADGYQEVRVPLRVEGGEDSQLKIELLPVNAAQTNAAPEPLPPPALAPMTPTSSAPPPKKMSTATTIAWVAAAGAVALAGTSAAFWFVGDAKYNKLEKSCAANGCSDKQLSGVKSDDTLATVFLSLSGAAVITSVVCFVVGAGGSNAAADTTEKASAHLSVGPTSLQLQGSF